MRREIQDGIIAIGGHPKWASMLREATGIRIWPVGTTCQPSVIAAATEIWIQAAYMDHSSFYAAIDAARKANVPAYIIDMIDELIRIDYNVRNRNRRS